MQMRLINSAKVSLASALSSSVPCFFWRISSAARHTSQLAFRPSVHQFWLAQKLRCHAWLNPFKGCQQQQQQQQRSQVRSERLPHLIYNIVGNFHIFLLGRWRQDLSIQRRKSGFNIYQRLFFYEAELKDSPFGPNYFHPFVLLDVEKLVSNPWTFDSSQITYTVKSNITI